MTDLEERGLPTVFVATTEFVDAADAQSRALGFSPPRVFLPHPIQDRTDEEMADLAREFADDVIAKLLADPAVDPETDRDL